MKCFFAKLIIFALVLTAPLSFTGDRCPDFKPDCVRSNYAEKARAVSVVQQRTAPGRHIRSRAVPAAEGDICSFSEPPHFKPFQQFLKDRSHGRAPPHLLTASA